MIEWKTKKCSVIYNPHHELPIPPEMENHIILSTSGSKKPKWVYLSKEAFLTGAESIIKKMDVKKGDQWLIALPLFHVAGIAILARCELTGGNYKVFSQKKWEPNRFIEELEDCHYTSLVPTQLFDLVNTFHRPPRSLKGVLIGGDKINKDLYEKAIERGWPVYRGYGMTESAATIAISDLNEWDLKPLPQNRFKFDRTIKIAGPTLLTAYFDNRFFDPKQDGWFDTGDEGIDKGDSFEVIGRLNQFKVGGELFSLTELQQKLDHFNTINSEAVLVVKPCERLGSKLVLYHNHPYVERMIDPFNGIVHPLVRVKEHVFMDQLPRNIIGKVVVS